MMQIVTISAADRYYICSRFHTSSPLLPGHGPLPIKKGRQRRAYQRSRCHKIGTAVGTAGARNT
jgi:hypothetical protein